MANRPLKNDPVIIMVAGEASGDLHGAQVIKALRNRHPHMTIRAVGGEAMAAAGADLILHSETLSVMGFTAVFAKFPVILKAMRYLKSELSRTKPDLLILIDFPDFNLHLANTAKKLAIPVLYYISPTVWAWRARRIHKIKARVSHMAVILPFEAKIYRQHGIPVTFVGHPLLDTATSTICNPLPFPRSSFQLALLPGSRAGEINRLLPVLIETAQILQKHIQNMKVIISQAPSIPTDLIQSHMVNRDLDHVEISNSPVEAIFQKSNFAIITSGTASLEAAIAGMPMAIVYSTSLLNYGLAKLFVNVSHIGLANLISGRRIVPELIQREASAENIAGQVLEIVNDPDKYNSMRNELLDVRQLMGERGAGEKVASLAEELIGA
jgi:lipid-A-disaccharide synthase